MVIKSNALTFSGSNFQSWQDFNIEIEGLTVVTGVSSRGKSALFRALNGLLRNEISANQVRRWWDTKQKAPLELTLKYGDHEIKARRARGDSTTFKIDGKPFTSLARQIPDEVKKLGFNEIKVGEFTVDPIFASQFDPLFLLEKKAYGPGLLNSVLGAFGGTEKLELGKKQANLLVTQKNADARSLSVEIAEANARAGKLQTLAAQGDQIAKEIHALEASARRLEARAAWTTLTHQRLTRLARIASIGRGLQIPDTSELDVLELKLQILATIDPLSPRRRRYVDCVFLGGQLEAIGEKWKNIVRLYRSIEGLKDLLISLKKQERFFQTTKVDFVMFVDSLERTVAIEKVLKQLAVVQQIREKLHGGGGLWHQLALVDDQRAALLKLTCPNCGTEIKLHDDKQKECD